MTPIPNRKNFWPEVFAGLTLAAIGIPEVMGYTQIIGTPVVTGLYTMIWPIVVFALFGSSRHMVVAADSATAAIVAAALVSLAPRGSSEYVQLTCAVAAVTGAFLLLSRLLRLGFLANFLSRTVLIGFLTGVGIQVALGQIRGMLELTDGSINVWAAAISAMVILLAYGFGRIFHRFPGALMALILCLAGNTVLDFKSHGVLSVGQVPAGWPGLAWPVFQWPQMTSIVMISFSCFVVILAQSAATARAYAFRFGERWDENRDLVGLGIANLAAAVSGTFVVNGSPTKTEIAVSAGARSQFANLIAALVVVLTCLFLTRTLDGLPECALAALVFSIGLKLIDVRGLRNVFRYSRHEFWLAILTAVTVVALGVEKGILLAIGLSLLNHVRRSYLPATAVLVSDGRQHWIPVPVSEAKEERPGLLVFQFSADLFYANVDQFKDQVEMLVQKHEGIKWLVIDAGAITGIDFSARQSLQVMHKILSDRRVRLVWVHVYSALRLRLNELGWENDIYESLRDVLAAYSI